MAAVPQTQNCQIYVGDLNANVNEQFLRQLFEPFGKIVDLQLKQHRSLDKKFAFITYENREEANNAIQDLNYTKLDGTPIRISFSDSELKRLKNSGNLFISGLDKTIEVSQLHEAFSNFGEIISCKIPLTNGESRGYGYIQFRNKADAERAKTDLADASINGKKINIEDYQPRTKKDPDTTYTNVYIRNLPPSIDSAEKLRDLFAQFGEVQSPKIQTDKDGKNLPFAYCNMVHHEDAVRAVEELNGKEIDGFVLYATRAMTKKERAEFLQKQKTQWRLQRAKETKDRNLFIKGFAKEVTEEELTEFFKQFGEIESLSIHKDQNGESCGFAFVLYKDKESADRALNDAVTIPFHDKILYINHFETKETHQRNMAKQRMARRPQGQGPTAMYMGGAFGEVPSVPTTKVDQVKLRIKEEKGITGKQLKEILVKLSEDQADLLLQKPELMQKFLDSL